MNLNWKNGRHFSKKKKIYIDHFTHEFYKVTDIDQITNTIYCVDSLLEF